VADPLEQTNLLATGLTDLQRSKYRYLQKAMAGLLASR